MKKELTVIAFLVLLFSVPMVSHAQQSISQDSLQTSSQNSLQESTGASSETSSQQSSAHSSQDSTRSSSQWSTDGTTNSPQASMDATSNSTKGNASVVALVVAGAAVSIALTVGGIILTVNVSKARKEEVLGLQDQIYLADGKDYQRVLDFFELGDRDVGSANDQLVTAGGQIESDQEAADYLAALMLALAEKSEKVQRQLGLL